MLLKFFSLLGLTVILIDACPSGSVKSLTIRDMCYTWTNPSNGDLPATYDEAEELCKKKGGHLATIGNQRENAYLLGLLADEESDGYYWIGINAKHGKLTWENGSPVGYTNWDKGEPSVNLCGFFFNCKGKWFTDKCETKRNYICRIPSQRNMARNISSSIATVVFVAIAIVLIFVSDLIII